MKISARFFGILLISLSIFSDSYAAITINDSHGPQTFTNTPQRIITLSWAIAEDLIELGIEPLAIADIHGYQEWVVRPSLPPQITDVGTRNEPNIERIADLKPDMIIITDQQAELIEHLKKIAPVLYFTAYDSRHNNYEVARHIFLELARLFDRMDVANQKLAALDSHLTHLKNTLAAHFVNKLPPVTCVRFNNTSVLWIYGDNSMPQYALGLLGFQPALPQPATQWGVTQKKVTELGKIKDGIVLHIEPFDQADKLFTTPLWKAMPFVRNGHFAAVKSTWTYGGLVSIQYLAESLAEALLSIKP
jgi:iron complex transport system substrate-binding protein